MSDVWGAFCAQWLHFTPDQWLAGHGLAAIVWSYTDGVKSWLGKSGHYLEGPPAGALVAIGVSKLVQGLWGPVPGPELVGLALIGRPIARALPQDGSWGELTRFVLLPGLPRMTASMVLRVAFGIFFSKGRGEKVITYHDRTRHTGCIYKKAGMRKDGVTRPGTRRGSWASRPNRKSSTTSELQSKRRWCIDKVVAA